MLKITVDGYLKSTRLGREGEKSVTFEFSAKDSVEVAKLELMGRDLVNHLPVLLTVSVEVSNEQKSRSAAKIQDAGRITRKNKRVF